MNTPSEVPSWFGPSSLTGAALPPEQPTEFVRLWRGFMTARVTLGLMLLLLQGVLFALGQSHSSSLMLICLGYFLATLVVRLLYSARRLGPSFDPQWIVTIGVDVLAFGALQFLQGASINYAPLLALPVLLASVLGSLPLALGTAAGVTLLLLSHAGWLSLTDVADPTARFAQSALTGAGGFVIAFLANQVSTRLASEEQKSRSSQLAMGMQLQVNELVIESLTDGVLVVDARGRVRAANPAARHLLGADHSLTLASFELRAEPGWQALLLLTGQSFAQNGVHQADVTIHHVGQGPRHVRVTTRLTGAAGRTADSLCVMFLQDQREMEARMRSSRLASMGRMSAAVAHEIRNPLAAIVQANALLDEDMADPRHRQLTQMVQQNARRLEKIVDDVLNVSRIQSHDSSDMPQALALDESVARICRDWAQQSGAPQLLLLQPTLPHEQVAFESEHLRRVLVNLLDNARRHASERPHAIQISTRMSATGRPLLGVWSDGAPLEKSVERHLFEPFFSSESRSSGLGLYICRELCERYGASMSYQRTSRTMQATEVEGNEFLVLLRRLAPGQQPGLF
jgi:two-component system sensor histidine kinase PilS (NtrC family)